MKRNKLYFLFIVSLFYYTVTSQNNQRQINNDDLSSNLKNSFSDSLLLEYQKSKLKNLIDGDTISAIKNVIDISNIYSSTGNYSQSYDGYWDALIYSNAISDSTYIGKIYTKLGTLYSIFRREKKALQYFEHALNVAKNYPSTSQARQLNLLNTYYIMASHYTENGSYSLAEKYLDSCQIIRSKLKSDTKAEFLEAKQGYIYYFQEKYDAALNLLLSNENYFLTQQPSYLVIFYSFLGDIYFKKKNYTKSESYYVQALEFSKKHQSHSNFVPNLYQKLGDLYFKINKKDLAYENLQLSKDLSEQLFGVRSRTNSDILEIKDAFRIENEKQNAIIEKTKLNKLEEQQKTLFFRNIALTVSIISLLLISGIIVWYLYKRRRSEKEEFITRQRLNKEKNAEIIALKNRELTSSALQLIQKDTLISEIKESLKPLNKRNEKVIKEILTKIKINKNFDWDEFNSRFTSVNKFFYKSLSDKFPELTRRDHRLCALIKLNFSSKEISQILGISALSVNTSRYRLRKKMGLKTDENLFETINTM